MMISKRLLLVIGLLLLSASDGLAQSSYPIRAMDASLVPVSPDAEGMNKFGQIPVDLYAGTPRVGIPVYEVKCGSLTLPISLLYNYNGLRPREDASWVGLGWSLYAGGVVSRIIEGQVDGSEASGYNYDQDTIAGYFPSNGSLYEDPNFFAAANEGLYDLAPDVFSYQMNGDGGKFIWYRGKAYSLPFGKDSIYKSPDDDYVRIISTNGTLYLFQAKETSSQHVFFPGHSHSITYASSWFLTQIISANKKDTIRLNYSSPGTYQWNEYISMYTENYSQSYLPGACPDTGLTNNYDPSPSITALVLQSIDCRNVHISFTVGNRTDIYGNYPKLTGIAVTDKLTGKIVNSYAFNYGYFGTSAQTDTIYGRLKLSQFRIIDPSGTNLPDQVYSFKYYHESASFPSKGTKGIDHWGYYNGADDNTDLFPSDTLSFGHGDRSPNMQYCSYGALDTLVYPSKGMSVFTYQQNTYSDQEGGSKPGPGIRISKMESHAFSSETPSHIRKFLYLNDKGHSSGFLYHPPDYYSFFYTNNTCSYKIYQANENGSYGSITDNPFYYRKVTQEDSSNHEIHKTDYYFNTPSYLYDGVVLIKQVDYYDDPATSVFTPERILTNTFVSKIDTAFLGFGVYIGSETTQLGTIYGIRRDTFPLFWKYQASSEMTFFDHAGNQTSSKKMFFYNNTRNLSEIQEQHADGKEIVEKFKYPEDYTSSLTGNMITHHVLDKVIEHQSWLKKSSSDSSLISGNIVHYDPATLLPDETYQLYLSSPLKTLNGETKTGGLYNTVVSDSHYSVSMHYLHNANGMLIQQNKANDAPKSYIWGYNNTYPIAIVDNASAAKIAYSSFETSEKGNWLYNGTPSPGGKTGTHQYLLSAGSISSNALPAGTYVISFWSTGTAVTVTGGSVSNVLNGESDGTSWKLFQYRATLSGSGTIILSGSSTIDELRLYPAGAAMTSYTYDPSIGISSKCDLDNSITYFQYDGFNRLSVQKDQQGNIIKTINQHDQQ